MILTLEPWGWQEKAIDLWKNPETMTMCCMCGRGSGKTLLFELLATDFAFSAPNRKILYFAQSHKLIKEIHNDMLSAPGFEQLLKPKNGHPMNPTPTFKFQNGSILQMISLNQGAGSALGLEAHMMIVDEAREIRQNDWDSLQPCVNRLGGKTLVLSTIRSRAHWFTTLAEYGEKPNEEGIRTMRVKSSEGICYAGKAGAAKLRRVKATTATHKFLREYECVIAQSDDAVFSPELIDGCIDHELKPRDKSEDETLLLVDLGRKKDPTAVLVMSQQGELLHSEQMALGMDWDRQVDRMKVLADKYDSVVVVESNGTNADALIDLLKPRLSPHRVVDIPIRGSTKQNLVDGVVIALENKKIKIPGHEHREGPHPMFADLCRQLEALEYKDNQQYVGYRSELHDDHVSCLMLGVEALNRSYAGPILSASNGPKRRPGR